MNECPHDGFAYDQADQHYVGPYGPADETPAFLDDSDCSEGELDELVEVPAGEDSAKGRNYTNNEKMTVLRAWCLRRHHLECQLASAMGRQNRSRHEQALQAATEPNKETTKEDYSLLDLPEVIVGDLYLGLPCTDALALGSTCRTLQQLLQPLRFAKIEQYLKSGELAPLVQNRVVDRRSASLGVGYTNLYFSWTVRASRILYHLVTKEKFPPDVL